MKLVLSHLDSLYSCDFCLNDIPKFLSASNLGFSVSQSVFPQGLEQGMVSTTPSGEQSGCQFSCPPLPLSLMLSAKPASSQERCRSGLTLPRAAAHSPQAQRCSSGGQQLPGFSLCGAQSSVRAKHTSPALPPSLPAGGAGSWSPAVSLWPQNRHHRERRASFQTTQAAIWKWRIFFWTQPFSRREKIPLLVQAHPRPGVWLHCIQHDNKHLAEFLFPSGLFLWFPCPSWHFLPLLLYKDSYNPFYMLFRMNKN